MRGLVFLLCFGMAFVAKAQVSVCASYDVENLHPDDLRVSLVIKCMQKDEELYLDGAVDENLIYELKVYNEKPIKKLFLNSTGGRVEDAYEIAAFIRENNIETIVRPGAVCMSACTLLFQAGVKRRAHKESVFMYHGVRYSFESSKIKHNNYDCLNVTTTEVCLEEIALKRKALEKKTEEFFKKYVLYGASSNLYEDYLKLELDPDWIKAGNYIQIKDWYLKAEDLAAYNVVTSFNSSYWSVYKYEELNFQKEI